MDKKIKNEKVEKSHYFHTRENISVEDGKGNVQVCRFCKVEVAPDTEETKLKGKNGSFFFKKEVFLTTLC